MDCYDARVVPQLGLSTRLLRDVLLDAPHLTRIARHGFTSVALEAVRTHLDYSDPAVARTLASSLASAGLTLQAISAPRAEGVRGQAWVAPFSLASDDAAERDHALGEIRLALAMAATLTCPALIVHLERPGGGGDGAPESLASVRRSLDALMREAEEARVALALRSGRAPQARPEALARLIERDLDGSPIGIALDYAQAHLAGDVADAIETAGEFMTVALLSDNRGRKDERLVPGAGSINWDAAMMTTQKVGFSGPALIDVDAVDVDAALRQAAQARERLASLLISF